MKTLFDLIIEKSEKCPNKSALLFTDRSYTYLELLQFSRQTGSSLIKMGFKKGDKIAIITENCPEWGVCVFSIFSAGLVAVPLDAKLSSAEIGFILGHSNSKAVFCSSKYLGLIEETGFNIEKIPIDMFTKKDKTKKFELGDDYSYPKVELNSDDLAFIVYTSGTMGNPKGVMLTHNNILSNVTMAVGVLKKDYFGARFLSILPLNHTFEITAGFFSPIALEGTVCYLENLERETLLSTMKGYKPEIMLVVPSFLNFIYLGIEKRIKNLKNPAKFLFKIFSGISKVFQKIGIHIEGIVYKQVHKSMGGSLKSFISGAAPLGIDLIEKFKEMGIQISEGYGLTEASPVISFNPPHFNKAGSVGMVLKGITVRIEKNEGSEGGEIVVSGPNIMMGYYNSQQETLKVLKDGCLYTGDIGEISADGYLYIKGRSKNIIVSPTGKKIFPEEIEEKIKTSPFIKDVCVFGKKTFSGEDVFAVISVNNEILSKNQLEKEKYHEFFKDELDKISTGLAEYKRVKSFVLTETDMPKTSTLKLKRRVIIEMYNNNQIPEIVRNGAGNISEIDALEFLKLKEIISRFCNISTGEITLQTDLYNDLGVDSLQRIDLFLILEKEFQIPFPQEKIVSFKNLYDIYFYITNPIDFSVIIKEDLELPDILKYTKTSTCKLILRFFFYTFYRFFSKIFFDIKFSGIENIPKHPFILAPNHTSLLDVPLTLCAFKIKDVNNIYSPAAADFFSENLFLIYISDILLNLIPFFRKANYLKSLKVVIELLKNRKSILIFPEGFLSPDGKMQELKGGVAHIAWETKAPIVPVYIQGAYNVMPMGKFHPKAGKVRVFFGKPINIDNTFEEKSLYETHLKILKKLTEEIIKLKG